MVGVDGSPASQVALEWALAAAARTGARLQVLAVVPVALSWAGPFQLDPGPLDSLRAAAGDAARIAVERAVDAGPAGVRDVPVEVVVGVGAVAEHLVHRSAGADLLVVGSRGRGAVRSTLLGSVALHCSVHARCPVVVVHPAPEPEVARVVVGVDDSVPARLALARAIDEAADLGARVEAVVAVALPLWWTEVSAGSLPTAGELREHAVARARTIVEDVLAGRSERARPQIGVDAEVGAPGEVLVRRAAGATMLVVGNRSRSTLPGLLLGSAALHCVMHAPCPVLVVHHDRGDAGPAAP